MKGSSARLIAVLRAAILALALAVGGGPAAAWAQQSGDTATAAGPVDNGTEYAANPIPSREPPAATRYLAGAAVVAGAFVVGVVAAGTAAGGLVAAGAAAWLYAAMP